MTFNVNALILVQIAHFYIAYLLLKHILLKPGWIRMRREDEHDHKLERNFNVLHEEVERRAAYNTEQWAHYCQKLCDKKPELTGPVSRHSPLPCGAHTTATPQEELSLIQATKDKIVSHLRQD